MNGTGQNAFLTIYWYKGFRDVISMFTCHTCKFELKYMQTDTIQQLHHSLCIGSSASLSLVFLANIDVEIK